MASTTSQLVDMASTRRLDFFPTTKRSRCIPHWMTQLPRSSKGTHLSCIRDLRKPTQLLRGATQLLREAIQPLTNPESTNFCQFCFSSTTFLAVQNKFGKFGRHNRASHGCTPYVRGGLVICGPLETWRLVPGPLLPGVWNWLDKDACLRFTEFLN